MRKVCPRPCYFSSSLQRICDLDLQSQSFIDQIIWQTIRIECIKLWYSYGCATAVMEEEMEIHRQPVAACALTSHMHQPPTILISCFESTPGGNFYPSFDRLACTCSGQCIQWNTAADQLFQVKAKRNKKNKKKKRKLWNVESFL